MSQIVSQEGLEVVDRGPDWLFVRMHGVYDPTSELADSIWKLLDQHFIYRVVLEMDEVETLPSQLMGQLVMLHERLAQRGGSLKLCGLKEECEEVLHNCHLDAALPNHATREAAVWGDNFAWVY